MIFLPNVIRSICHCLELARRALEHFMNSHNAIRSLHSNTHTHTHQNAHTHTYTLSFFLSLSLFLALTQTHTHKYTKKHSLSRTYTQTHTFTSTLSSISLTHLLKHTHTHTHAHTRTHTTRLHSLVFARLNFCRKFSTRMIVLKCWIIIKKCFNSWMIPNLQYCNDHYKGI